MRQSSADVARMRAEKQLTLVFSRSHMIILLNFFLTKNKKAGDFKYKGIGNVDIYFFIQKFYHSRITTEV